MAGGGLGSSSVLVLDISAVQRVLTRTCPAVRRGAGRLFSCVRPWIATPRSRPQIAQNRTKHVSIFRPTSTQKRLDFRPSGLRQPPGMLFDWWAPRFRVRSGAVSAALKLSDHPRAPENTQNVSIFRPNLSQRLVSLSAARATDSGRREHFLVGPMVSSPPSTRRCAPT